MSGYLGDAYGMLKNVKKTLKQVALNLSEVEVKVEEATSNEPWGPHGTIMSEIAEAAYDSDKYKDIMGVLARRLQDKGENWRHVYKSLLLLEHMLKHGPMKVVHELRGNVNILDNLTRFRYADAKGKDLGVNVRNRAKTLMELVQDPERIKQERDKARQNRNKYGGVSSSEMRGGFGSGAPGGFSSGGRGFDSYDDYDEDIREERPRSYRAPVESPDFPRGGGTAREVGADASISQGAAARPPDKGEDPPAPEPAPKKKLSDTKVDPAISQMFSKMTVVGAGGNQRPAAAAARAKQPAPSGWDAFAAADPSPAAGDGWDAFAAAPAPPESAAPAADEWDAFASPGNGSGGGGSAADPFADFASAPPAQDPFTAALHAPADPFAAPPAQDALFAGMAPGQGGQQPPAPGHAPFAPAPPAAGPVPGPGMVFGMGAGPAMAQQRPPQPPQQFQMGFSAPPGGMQAPGIGGGMGMGMGMGAGMAMGSGAPAVGGPGVGAARPPQPGAAGRPGGQPGPRSGVGAGYGMAPNSAATNMVPVPKKKDPFADLSLF